MDEIMDKPGKYVYYVEDVPIGEGFELPAGAEIVEERPRDEEGEQSVKVWYRVAVQ